MFLKLVLAFTVIPVTEIFLLVRAGQWIGVVNTITVVLITGILGAWLARSQGRQILLRVQQKVALGQVPAQQMLEGVFIFAGGLLLLTPGFITDLLGFSMVAPGLRLLWVAAFARKIEEGIKAGAQRTGGFAKGPGVFYYDIRTGGEPSDPDVRDVSEAQVIEIEAKRTSSDHREGASDKKN